MRAGLTTSLTLSLPETQSPRPERRTHAFGGTARALGGGGVGIGVRF